MKTASLKYLKFFRILLNEQEILNVQKEAAIALLRFSQDNLIKQIKLLNYMKAKKGLFRFNSEMNELYINFEIIYNNKTPFEYTHVLHYVKLQKTKVIGLLIDIKRILKRLNNNFSKNQNQQMLYIVHKKIYNPKGIVIHKNLHVVNRSDKFNFALECKTEVFNDVGDRLVVNPPGNKGNHTINEVMYVFKESEIFQDFSSIISELLWLVEKAFDNKILSIDEAQIDEMMYYYFFKIIRIDSKLYSRDKTSLQRWISKEYQVDEKQSKVILKSLKKQILVENSLYWLMNAFYYKYNDNININDYYNFLKKNFSFEQVDKLETLAKSKVCFLYYLIYIISKTSVYL